MSKTEGRNVRKLFLAAGVVEEWSIGMRCDPRHQPSDIKLSIQAYCTGREGLRPQRHNWWDYQHFGMLKYQARRGREEQRLQGAGRSQQWTILSAKSTKESENIAAWLGWILCRLFWQQDIKAANCRKHWRRVWPDICRQQYRRTRANSWSSFSNTSTSWRQAHTTLGRTTLSTDSCATRRTNMPNYRNNDSIEFFLIMFW